MALALFSPPPCPGQAGPDAPPIASAGDDRESPVGTSVVLDGRASRDPEGAAIVYAWRFAGRPSGSRAVLFGADSPLASFTPDVAGDFFVELTVSDGTSSASDALRLRATGSATVAPPQAVISGPGQARPGDRVVLDGSGSISFSGSSLTYAWKQVFGATVSLAGTSTPFVSFRPLLPGAVSLELVVTDAVAASPPRTRTVLVLDQPPSSPVAIAGEDRVVFTDRPVRLQGSFLTPRGPGSATLRWTYEAGPVAELFMKDRATVSPEFTPPAEGPYTFRFEVIDAPLADEDRVTVTAVTAPVEPAPGTSSSLGGCGLGAGRMAGGPPDALALLAVLALLWRGGRGGGPWRGRGERSCSEAGYRFSSSRSSP